ncbi:MAG: L-histidine N(alpha)-methyltransferase, partial [Burkholderiaceae bacterium]
MPTAPSQARPPFPTPDQESALAGPRFVQVHQDDQSALVRELTDGLLQPQAQVSPKFLYDALGSRLFEAITELPEYYPTRTEAEIFALHGQDMARVMPERATLIDLGAGNCQKAASLFGRFAPQRYV